MKRYIIFALLISAITAGLSAGDRSSYLEATGRVSGGPVRGKLPKKPQPVKPVPAQTQRAAQVSIAVPQSSMIPGRYRVISEPRYQEYDSNITREAIPVAMPMQPSAEHVRYVNAIELARRVQQLRDDEAMEQERKRQRSMRILSTGLHPESSTAVRRAMRKGQFPSALESPGRRYEYPVALEREGMRGISFDYDAPWLEQKRDRAAYETLEPNAPAPQPWLERPEVMGARRRPFYKQLKYMPQEYVTPEMGEAYEQMRPSKVRAYEMPQPNSWRNLWGLQK